MNIIDIFLFLPFRGKNYFIDLFLVGKIIEFDFSFDLFLQNLYTVVLDKFSEEFFSTVNFIDLIVFKFVGKINAKFFKGIYA